MSNSPPITRSRVQQTAKEDTSSPLKLKKAQSTRPRSTRSTLKVFQDAPLSTPSKSTGSRQTKTPLQPTSTNILPKSSVSSGKLQKGDGALDFNKPTVVKPVVTVDDGPTEEVETPSKLTQSTKPETSNDAAADPSQDEQLSRLLARRLLSQSSGALETPVRNRIAPLGQQSMFSDSTTSLLATPPQQISYSDLLSPFLSDSKIPTLNPVFNLEDLLLPLAISPLALSQAYLNALGPLTPKQQSIYAASLSHTVPVLQPTPSSNMTPPATHVSTHRLDRSPKAKMRYSPSRQQWFSVDEETGSPRVAEEERGMMASPGSPTRRGTPMKMSGLQLLEKKSSRKAQHVELGRGIPSPLAKTSKIGTPVKSLVSEDKDLDDVRRLREASLEFDFVRATASPLSAKARNANVSRIHSDTIAGSPMKQMNDQQTSSASIPAGFAEFLAKTRVVSEPILTCHSATAEENEESLRSASSRRRSKRKKAKLPVPEPDAEPLSWNALQQKFIEAQVSEEYETIRSTYEKVAEELEATPVPAKQTDGGEDQEAQQESSTSATQPASLNEECNTVA
ncbi:hypothetical protein QFC22_005321 [Naganishia vaughanmartiniae]|uniref:Uncharacterized protein n=1 Tax=Naganishia vaughanmartiniae TaxID=1424756 RepID=A0ACC2WU72_9TREE|nr:hypothetical protein QFC22_005321 [Naganishia vaughanmartiniae]